MLSSAQEMIDEETGSGVNLLDAGAQERSIGYKLRLAQILAYQAFEARVSGYGSAPRYLGLLCIIQANPGQSQSRLAEAIALKRSSLVPILDRLEKEGVLERRATENDRRSNTVWLTEKGQGIVAALIDEADKHEQILCQDISPGQKEQLLSGLDAMIARLRVEEAKR